MSESIANRMHEGLNQHFRVVGRTGSETAAEYFNEPVIYLGHAESYELVGDINQSHFLRYEPDNQGLRCLYWRGVRVVTVALITYFRVA